MTAKDTSSPSLVITRPIEFADRLKNFRVDRVDTILADIPVALDHKSKAMWLIPDYTRFGRAGRCRTASSKDSIAATGKRCSICLSFKAWRKCANKQNCGLRSTTRSDHTGLWAT